MKLTLEIMLSEFRYQICMLTVVYFIAYLFFRLDIKQGYLFHILHVHNE